MYVMYFFNARFLDVSYRLIIYAESNYEPKTRVGMLNVASILSYV